MCYHPTLVRLGLIKHCLKCGWPICTGALEAAVPRVATQGKKGYLVGLAQVKINWQKGVEKRDFSLKIAKPLRSDGAILGSINTLQCFLNCSSPEPSCTTGLRSASVVKLQNGTKASYADQILLLESVSM